MKIEVCDKPFKCFSDTCDVCDWRFKCYVDNAFPEDLLNDVTERFHWFSAGVEHSLFGNLRGRIAFDYDAYVKRDHHVLLHKFKCDKCKSMFLLGEEDENEGRRLCFYESVMER